MTPSATEFVQPLTFQALSGLPVLVDIFEPEAESAMDHIDLARWCDMLVIAPASADSLAKLAAGYADNLLLTIALATTSPIAVAPAMNQQMFADAATESNIATLMARGIRVWGPDAGEQIYTEDEFNGAVQQYYEILGLNPATGRPLRGKLLELGLHILYLPSS